MTKDDALTQLRSASPDSQITLKVWSIDDVNTVLDELCLEGRIPARNVELFEKEAILDDFAHRVSCSFREQHQLLKLVALEVLDEYDEVRRRIPDALT